MNNLSTLTISPFQPQDQAGVKELILAGLADHWGQIDPTKNPDLNDISASYAGATFVVARLNGKIVGTGALVPRTSDTAEVVRMSVAGDVRRHGIGKSILEHLLAYAKDTGFRRVILETTDTWTEVIQFYLNAGFRITHYEAGDVYFSFDVGIGGLTV